LPHSERGLPCSPSRQVAIPQCKPQTLQTSVCTLTVDEQRARAPRIRMRPGRTRPVSPGHRPRARPAIAIEGGEHSQCSPSLSLERNRRTPPITTRPRSKGSPSALQIALACSGVDASRLSKWWETITEAPALGRDWAGRETERFGASGCDGTRRADTRNPASRGDSRKEKGPGDYPGPSDWWRRRESNPRPRDLRLWLYMRIRVFVLAGYYPTGREDNQRSQ
jgi:hypothetical protein